MANPIRPVADASSAGTVGPVAFMSTSSSAGPLTTGGRPAKASRGPAAEPRPRMTACTVCPGASAATHASIRPPPTMARTGSRVTRPSWAWAWAATAPTSVARHRSVPMAICRSPDKPRSRSQGTAGGSAAGGGGAAGGGAAAGPAAALGTGAGGCGTGGIAASRSIRSAMIVPLNDRRGQPSRPFICIACPATPARPSTAYPPDTCATVNTDSSARTSGSVSPTTRPTSANAAMVIWPV